MRFNREMTLNELMEYMEKNGYNVIRRILRNEEGIVVEFGNE